MSDFLFSVVTPIHRFNALFLKKLGESIADFIDAVPSIFAPSCQWLISIDSSSINISDVSKVLAEFEDKISITIIPKDPSSFSSPGAARNRALNLASSEWLLTLDEDDFIEPIGFLRLFEALKANPDAYWVAGKAFDVSPKGEYLNDGPPSTIKSGLNFKGFFYAYRVSKGSPPFHPSATIVRTDIVKKLGGWPRDWQRTEDTALWCLIDLFYQGLWFPVNALAYRKHPDSVTQQKDYHKDTSDLMVKISEFILQENTNPS